MERFCLFRFIAFLLVLSAVSACSPAPGTTTNPPGTNNLVFFTVTFDSQGGSAVTPQSVVSNGLATEPAAPTKAGNSLEGWYRNPSFTTGWNFTTDTVVSNITLYAKWVEFFAFSFATNAGEITIYDCDTAYSGSINIPSTINGYPVTSISNNAFQDCINLTSITIPDSVTSMGNSVFYGCFGLTSATIPNNVTSMGDYVFRNCTGLTSVTIGSNVTSIGMMAFINCTSLTSITIPDSVTSIGYDAFYNCSGLTSVTIGSGVTSIDTQAFVGCNGLTSIVIPDGVTIISGYTFQGCSGLTSVTLGSGVTSIGDYAFQNCGSLPSFTIPNSVTSIGIMAFVNCTAMTNLNMYPLTAPALGSNPFLNVTNCTLHIQSSGTAGYGVAPWTTTSIFSSIVSDL